MNAISPQDHCPTEFVLTAPLAAIATALPLDQPVDAQPVLAIVASDHRAAALLNEARRFTVQITQHDFRYQDHPAPLHEADAVLVDLLDGDPRIATHLLRQAKRSVLAIGCDVPHRVYDHYAAMAAADINVLPEHIFHALFPSDYPDVNLETMAIHGIEGIAVVVHDSRLTVWGVLDVPWHYVPVDAVAAAAGFTLDRLAAALACSLAEIGESWTAMQRACELLGWQCIDGPLSVEPRRSDVVPPFERAELTKPHHSLVGHAVQYARTLFAGRGS